MTQSSVNKKETFQKAATNWFNRSYPLIFAFLFFFFVVISFIPPLLMKVGATKIAIILYRLFKFLCHQLPFRSFFLFGAQPYYPLEAARMSQIPLTFEAALEEFSLSFDNPANFYGNELMGYKGALCQRDIAIYLGFGLFCLIFYLSRNRIKRVHWAIWLTFGIVPIGLDGGSQLVSWILPFLDGTRESTPIFRVVTGGLFGWMTAWFILPFLDKNLQQEYDEPRPE
ncbi:MAG: DUF2085 domain-containing protein [Chloroflexi bacterium]|nr:DUF2085 domain-containing protein [Chloroflexota bacterium]